MNLLKEALRFTSFWLVFFALISMLLFWLEGQNRDEVGMPAGEIISFSCWTAFVTAVVVVIVHNLFEYAASIVVAFSEDRDQSQQ